MSMLTKKIVIITKPPTTLAQSIIFLIDASAPREVHPISSTPAYKEVRPTALHESLFSKEPLCIQDTEDKYGNDIPQSRKSLATCTLIRSVYDPKAERGQECQPP